jgi:hypothetical protein
VRKRKKEGGGSGGLIKCKLDTSVLCRRFKADFHHVMQAGNQREDGCGTSFDGKCLAGLF